ncbi:glycosyltransferase family 4 protein [Pseudoclavibacter terrae]|uniref:glycosyltransferase family 4 protein n=1 Tax=Pseudoclavibacter terrae TaxID=1530195 RepID=UPI001AD7CC60|nr:glycosyltransferase family 4 protein [Pseudoclavibacter terrae]
MAVGESEADAQRAQAQRPIALWVVPVSGLGGVARHVLDVAAAGLPGYELVVLSPEGPLAAELRDRGARVAVGKFGPDFGVLASIRTLRTAAQRLRPAVVHSHLAYADVIVAATPLPPGTVRVTTEHGIAGDDQVYHRTAAKSKIMAKVHGIRLRRFDRVIAVAEATRRAMIDKWSPSQDIRVILNGVDPVEQPRPARSRQPSLRILALARLSPEKRIPQLLRAFRIVLDARPDAHLTIAGVGELDSELKALAADLGISESVTFPGFVDPEDAMADADVLAQLSVWENCSYSLLDAANRGMRVIASRVGGNPEIVAPRGLVDADDIDAVAAALLDEAAETHLDNWLSVADMTRAVAEVYAEALGGVEHRALPGHVTLATNNGDIGGGEVMLLSIADALRTLGVAVTIVGPAEPAALVAAARERGHSVVELPAKGRKQWIAQLRSWDAKNRDGVLWCNGLVPAFATSFHPQRIVHLHQRPTGAQRLLAPIARFRSLRTLVPSASMQEAIPGSTVLPNWSERVVLPKTRTRKPGSPVVIGFLGRFSVDKGVPVLAEALAQLEQSHPGQYRLRMAGEPRFVSDSARADVETALAPVSALVEFTGWVLRDEFLADIDLLVVPSVWAEPFGLVVSEAMSARVPVIVSDAGALPEVIGDMALVFESGDAAALAAAIRERFAQDPSRTVDDQFARWQSTYSPEAGARRVASLLATIQR